jgi:hypothetical protein
MTMADMAVFPKTAMPQVGALAIKSVLDKSDD